MGRFRGVAVAPELTDEGVALGVGVETQEHVTLVATLGIFLPSFCFVALVNPLIPRLRRSKWTSGFLDGVIAGSLGLMAVVTWKLASTTLTDWLTGLLALLSAIALSYFRVNTTWLVGGGAIVGLIVHLVGL